MLKLEQVKFTPKNRVEPIIYSLDYNVNHGDRVMLLGSNGSGKSTLMQLIHRDLTPDSGVIYFNNQSINKINRAEFVKKVILLTQSVTASLFSAMTVLENGLLWEMRTQGLFYRSKKQRIIALEHYFEQYYPNLISKLHRSVDLLSGGERQLLVLALCLRYPPDILLLDEHTSALDPKTGREIMEMTDQLIRAKQITTIITTHNLDYATRYGNRLLAIHAGKIVYQAYGQQKQALNFDQLFKLCYDN